MSEKNVAIVLAAGKGSRMNSTENKQFLMINGKPMLFYSLRACDETSCIDQVIVVAAEGEEERIREEVIEKYGIKKVRTIVQGGKERVDSVYNGIRAIEGACNYVFIHDGARPCVTAEIFDNAYSSVKKYGACVIAVRQKDTVRRVSPENGMAEELLDRSDLWNMQTPQAFSCEIIKKAFQKYYELDLKGATDDASVVEDALGYPIHIVEGSYKNIKVTTAEDIAVAEVYLKL